MTVKIGYTKDKCRKLLSNKIAVNMKEYNAGKFSNRAQAIAVSYSQIKKNYPYCSRFFNKLSRRSRSRKSRKSPKKGSRKSPKKGSHKSRKSPKKGSRKSRKSPKKGSRKSKSRSRKRSQKRKIRKELLTPYEEVVSHHCKKNEYRGPGILHNPETGRKKRVTSSIVKKVCSK